MAIYIRITGIFDHSISTMIRYPSAGVIHKFEEGNIYQFVPVIHVPNNRYINIETSVIAVPKTVTIDGLKIIDFLLNNATGEVIDIVSKKRPMSNLISKYFIGTITDQLRSSLEKGRIIGYGKNTPDTVAFMGGMGNDDFELFIDVSQ